MWVVGTYTNVNNNDGGNDDNGRAKSMSLHKFVFARDPAAELPTVITFRLQYFVC